MELDGLANLKRSFSVRLEQGDLLHLAVDQRGLDVVIDVLAPSGVLPRPLPAIDLLFGSTVREEVYLVAAQAGEIEIRLRAIGGRGQPRLKVLANGSAGAAEQERSRQFAAFCQFAVEGATFQQREGLRQQAASAGDPRLRLLAAASLGYLLVEDGQFAAARPPLDQALEMLSRMPDAPLEAQVRLQRARAAKDDGDLSSALADYQQVLAAPDEAGAATLAVIESDLANLAWEEDKTDAAIRHSANSRRHYQAGGYPDLALTETLTLARSLMRRGSSPEPLALLLRGLAEYGSRHSERPPPDETRAKLLREIGWWLLLEERPQEALLLLEKARFWNPGVLDTEKQLADARLALGDPAAARAGVESALASANTEGQRGSLQSALCRIDFAAGLLDSARSHCRKAAEHYAGDGKRRLPSLELSLAGIEQADGNLEAAEAHARNGWAALEEQRRQAGKDQEKLDFYAVRVDSAEMLIDLRLALLAQTGDPRWEKLALEAVESTRALLLQDLLAGADAHSRDDADDAGRRHRERELRQILEIHTGGLLATLEHEGTISPSDTRPLDEPLRRLEELRRELAGPPLPETVRAAEETPGFDLAAVQAELEPGTAMLVYYLGEKQAHGWVLTRRTLRSAPLGDSAALRRLAKSLHSQLARGADYGAFGSWSRSLAERIYSPFAGELEKAALWVVVAPAELQQVPFAALPFPADSGVPQLAARTLASLPSAAILPTLRHRAAARPVGERLLAIVDDPVYDEDPRLPLAARRRGPFPPLPDTADEGRMLLEMAGKDSGSVRIAGFEANRERLMGGALAGFRILHFATHARTGETPRGLVLSRYDPAGGRINDTFGFQELAALSLDADLAVTTACSSALGEEVAGEGLLGLRQGFLSAGIPRLLLTLWPIRGESSRRLVGQFYPLLFSGIAPVEALRRTQAAMRAEGRPAHEWGAFAIYGDWRPLPNLFPPAGQHRAVAGVDNQGGGRNPQPQPTRGVLE